MPSRLDINDSLLGIGPQLVALAIDLQGPMFNHREEAITAFAPFFTRIDELGNLFGDVAFASELLGPVFATVYLERGGHPIDIFGRRMKERRHVEQCVNR